MELRYARVVVSGRVQGVFFRQSTCDRARALNLRGWVRNLPGGEVEALFCGEAREVEAALAFVAEGPPAARVDRVEVVESKRVDAREISEPDVAPMPFEIRR